MGGVSAQTSAGIFLPLPFQVDLKIPLWKSSSLETQLETSYPTPSSSELPLQTPASSLMIKEPAFFSKAGILIFIIWRPIIAH